MTDQPEGTPDPQNPQREFWMKQPDETDYQYEAFQTFRDLGRGRRLRKAASKFYDREDVGATDSQYDQFRRWSAVNLWRARVEAYDAEQDSDRATMLQSKSEDMIDDHLKIVTLGLNVGAKELYAIARGEKSFPASQLPSLITAVTNLHRLTLGHAMSRAETTTGSAEGMPDYSQLTDEELDQLAAIGEKLYGLPTAEEQGRLAEGSKKRPKRRPPHE